MAIITMVTARTDTRILTSTDRIHPGAGRFIPVAFDDDLSTVTLRCEPKASLEGRQPERRSILRGPRVPRVRLRMTSQSLLPSAVTLIRFG